MSHNESPEEYDPTGSESEQPSSLAPVAGSAPVSDDFPIDAKPFYRARRQWLADMDRHALEVLAMNLLQKRECDGLNGRMWDSHRHLWFEQLIARELLPNK